eukprot:scaffold986_cov237-Pinguiococcus_pyrenoidosus.AAC.5
MLVSAPRRSSFAPSPSLRPLLLRPRPQLCAGDRHGGEQGRRAALAGAAGLRSVLLRVSQALLVLLRVHPLVHGPGHRAPGQD